MILRSALGARPWHVFGTFVGRSVLVDTSTLSILQGQRGNILYSVINIIGILVLHPHHQATGLLDDDLDAASGQSHGVSRSLSVAATSSSSRQNSSASMSAGGERTTPLREIAGFRKLSATLSGVGYRTSNRRKSRDRNSRGERCGIEIGIRYVWRTGYRIQNRSLIGKCFSNTVKAGL